MRKTSIGLMIFLACFLGIFIGSCSTYTVDVVKVPRFRVLETTLARDIDVKGNEGVPVNPASIFFTEDPDVTSFVRFENLSGAHELRWDWYNPEGALYYSTNNYRIVNSKGKFRREATAWHKIAIDGDPAQKMPGNWQVKIFLDDQLIATDKFQLLAKTNVDLIPTKIAKKPIVDKRIWGLIIAIEDYKHLFKVDYAISDAVTVKKYFHNYIGIPQDQLFVLENEKATKNEIEDVLQNKLPSKMNKNSRLFVYFAGHGVPDSSQSNLYLVPYDGDTRFVEYSCYQLDSLYQDIKNLQIQDSVIFLETCFSGVASRGAEMLISYDQPINIAVQKFYPPLPSMAVLAASTGTQVNNAYYMVNHGLFTYYLLLGLRGKADMNADRSIFLKELYNYVQTNVTRISTKMGKKQTPVIIPDLKHARNILIVR